MKQSPKYKINNNAITSVLSWEFGHTPNTGSPYIDVRLDHNISWRGWLTDRAFSNTMKQLRHMGLKGTVSDLMCNRESLPVNVEVTAKIDEIRDYNGTYYYKASFINRV